VNRRSRGNTAAQLVYSGCKRGWQQQGVDRGDGGRWEGYDGVVRVYRARDSIDRRVALGTEYQIK
jgi:hypothetical protein